MYPAHPHRTLKILITCLVICVAIWEVGAFRPAGAYPIDGYETTRIGRLEVQRRVQAGLMDGQRQPAGGLLSLNAVDLRLLDHPDIELPARDDELSAGIIALLGDRADHYQFAVLDLSDPNKPRYATHDDTYRANVGSVGKLLVALATFQALKDLHPDDIEARLAILRDTRIVADEFVLTDHHTVRMWDPATETLTRRRLLPDDVGSLYEYLDWMVSASSNSAASAVIRETMLMHQFGADYPVSHEVGTRFFAETPKSELAALLTRTLQAPVTANGFDLNEIRQGSFFTATGNRRVPATTSYATPRNLVQYLLRMEQGRLVDEFSSREIKRLMYSTERRIRYASSPALNKSAVYFKSGSLFQCEPEPGFKCWQYHGNVKNLMNSVAIVESPAGEPKFHYMVALMSNVLRRNSAVDHQTIATGIHELITTGAVTTATALSRTEAEIERAAVEPPSSD